MKISIVLVLFLAAAFYGVHGLTCYDCSLGDCENGLIREKTCLQKNAQCISVTSDINERLNYKGCSGYSIASVCNPLLKKLATTCYGCGTDLCNAGNSTTTS